MGYVADLLSDTTQSGVELFFVLSGVVLLRPYLRGHRPFALGFGVAVFLSFLIPLGAILLMPAAVAGAALLTRRALGQPIDIETVQARL